MKNAGRGRGNKFIDVTIGFRETFSFYIEGKASESIGKICISRTNLKLSRDRENLKGISPVPKVILRLAASEHKSLDGLRRRKQMFGK